MAFNPANFQFNGKMTVWVPADREGISLYWIYSTSENLSAITPQYFNSVANRIRKGDTIRVSATDGIGLFYVTTADFSDIYPEEVYTAVQQMDY